MTDDTMGTRPKRKKLIIKPGKVIVYIILLFCLAMTVYPLIFTLLSSLKSQNDLFGNIFGLPKKVMFQNYYDLFMVKRIQNNILHSLFISCTTVVIQVVICSMVAFVLSRFKFKFSNVLFIFFMAGILISQQSVLIPITLLAKTFNGFNNYFFMIIIYVAFGVPNFVFITTGFMKGLPHEMEEAAVIDGCSPAKIFWSIIMPLSTPAIASAAILSFFGAWNDLILALILLKDNTMQTISLGLISFTNSEFSNYTGQFAAVIISIIPTLVLYFLLQKQIMKGMTAGAVKG